MPLGNGKGATNMESTLTEASREWSTRPNDQRFATLQEMFLATWFAADASKTYDLAQNRLSVEVNTTGGLELASPAGPMKFSHWSFGQLCQRIGAPANWIRTLEPELAAQNLNAGLKRTGIGDDAQMYYRHTATGSNKLLALTSQKYGRIFNHDVIKTVMDLPGEWVSPLSMPKPGEPTRPATEEDLKYGTNLQVGEPVSLKRALYASDKDMFIFLVDPNRRLDDGTDGGLSRGFFVSNSEVGDATFEITKFLYRYVCRNNIVWGAQQVERVSVKHIGRGAKDRAFGHLAVELKAYAESSAAADEARIKSAKNLSLGNNLEEVQLLIYNNKKITSKKNVAAAYELATIYEKEDGNPNVAWGLANGLTRLSQQTPFTDERVALDKAAGEVLALAA
jgi:hypothetical protein